MIGWYFVGHFFKLMSNMNLVRKTVLLMSLVHSLLRFYDKAKYKKVYQLHDYKATEVNDPEAAGEIWIRPQPTQQSDDCVSSRTYCMSLA